MGYVVYRIIYTLFEIYSFLILVHILMSWLPNKRGIIGDIDKVLESVCEPYLGIFRRIIPPVGGSGMRIDFSPIIALIALQIITNLLLRFLAQFI